MMTGSVGYEAVIHTLIGNRACADPLPAIIIPYRPCYGMVRTYGI